MRTLNELLYKGKPYEAANVQADRVATICFCKFVAVGEPLDGRQCEVHGTCNHPCNPGEMSRCGCTNYRPNKVKQSPAHWPLCVCGHIAEEHD